MHGESFNLPAPPSMMLSYDTAHLHSDGLQKNLLRTIIFLGHEQTVTFIHESLGVIAVVPDGHVCVQIRALEFACARSSGPNPSRGNTRCGTNTSTFKPLPSIHPCMYTCSDVLVFIAWATINCYAPDQRLQHSSVIEKMFNKDRQDTGGVVHLPSRK